MNLTDRNAAGDPISKLPVDFHYCLGLFYVLSIGIDSACCVYPTKAVFTRHIEICGLSFLIVADYFYSQTNGRKFVNVLAVDLPEMRRNINSLF